MAVEDIGEVHHVSMASCIIHVTPIHLMQHIILTLSLSSSSSLPSFPSSSLFVFPSILLSSRSAGLLSFSRHHDANDITISYLSLEAFNKCHFQPMIIKSNQVLYPCVRAECWTTTASVTLSLSHGRQFDTAHCTLTVGTVRELPRGATGSSSIVTRPVAPFTDTPHQLVNFYQEAVALVYGAAPSWTSLDHRSADLCDSK